MPKDDDRFRLPGSRYENEEPIAIAVVPSDAKVDWLSDSFMPANTLWLPESLFDADCEGTFLRRISTYGQNRLTRAECSVLCDELLQVQAKSTDPDVLEAAKLLMGKAQEVASSTMGVTLLIEGP